MPSDRSLRYRVVDVFTNQRLTGNALAVFPEAVGIEDELMQAIAKELNLSETSFVVPATRADCVARVRIFTPEQEMVFAGHPTIGTSFVLLDEGIIPAESKQFVLEEQVGPVPIRVDHGVCPLIWLRTPPIQTGNTVDRRLCAQALGLNPEDLLAMPPQLLDAGNPTLFIALQDKAAVDRAWLDSRGAQALGAESAVPDIRLRPVFTWYEGIGFRKLFGAIA